MKQKIYTDAEKEILLKNPFVKRIDNDRFIVYDPAFKLWCVLKKITCPSETCRHLFYTAGFPINMMNPKLPQSRISSWINLYYRYGEEYFLTNELGMNLKKSITNSINGKIDTKLKENIYREVGIMMEEVHENTEEDRF